MKNATKHADALKSLNKKLLKEHKPAPRPQLNPLQALVRAAVSFDVSDAKADEAMQVIDQEFVDLNELRVATELEVQDLLGSRYPGIESRVAMITRALNEIFEREHTLSLDRLKTVSKRDARQFLKELPDLHPFVEAYVMLAAFDGNAFPIDDQTFELLEEAGVLEDGTSMEDAQKFVEHQLKADEMYPFFSAIRAAASSDSRPKGKKKVKS